MRNPRSPEAPFRLRQESCAGPAQRRRQTPGNLEAYPTEQGDYALGGRDTYPLRQKIKAAGGRWDTVAQKWFVTLEQAVRLGATAFVRVIRAPACCEKYLEPLVNRGVPTVASQAEVMAERMTVRFCSLCDSSIREIVTIRDVLDTDELPDLED